MKKLLNILQPLIDHLYIFQLYEYQTADLLKWFWKHPFKRKLQKKGHIEYTSHGKAILIISLGLIAILSYFLSAGFASFCLFFLLFLQISPFFIVTAQFLFKPLEMYQRNKIVSQAIAKRKKLDQLQVVAIVGSYAKTSTKNMLYTLLWKDFKVVKTPKSYNTELSIARSVIADLKQNTEVFICEMDAYHKGEISRLCKIAQPTQGIITAIGPQHLQRFGSMEALVNSQFELAQFLHGRHSCESGNPQEIQQTDPRFYPKGNSLYEVARQDDIKRKADGVLFLNELDEYSEKLGKKLEQNVIFYNNNAAFISDRVESGDGQNFVLHLNAPLSSSLLKGERAKQSRQSVKVHLPLKGEHNSINFLAAAVIADYLGVPLKTIADRAGLIQSTEHRLEVRNVGERTILDNTYNANPQSALASLNLLDSYKGRQKVLVTPGFVELGKDHNKAHQQFAKDAAKIADIIIIVGEHAKKPLLKGLEQAHFSQKQIHLVETEQKALAHLSEVAQESAVVLLENDLPDQYS